MGQQKLVDRSQWLIVIAAGALMGAALGVRHTQGLFLQPVTFSHGWSRETFGFALALQNLIWGLVQPITGIVADRFGSRRVLFVGAIVYALGLLVMARAGDGGAFTLGNGVLIGIGLSGTAFGAVYGALSRIFPPAQRSWALGVAGAIGGLGQFFMVPFVQTMIGNVGWSTTAMVLAALMVVLSPLCVLLKDAGPVMQAEQEQTLRSAVREAFAHRGFWLLTFGFLACGFQLAFIAAHLPAYLLDKGLGPKQASIALAIVALANVVGTYACGYLGGFLRRKYLLSAIYLIRVVAMLLFWTLPLSEWSVYVFAAVMGLIWLGTVPLTNGVVSQVFGVRYISTLFGFVFFGHQLGGFLGVWLGGMVFDATHSYDWLWACSIGLGLLAAVLHLPINDGQSVAQRPLAVGRKELA
jgi:MFS family permease